MAPLLVFWDIDGTLMHCGAAGTKALNETFLQLFGVSGAFEKAGIGRAMDSAILGRIIDQNNIGREELPAIESRFLANLKEILDSLESMRVLPGVRGLLHYFEGSGAVNSLLSSNLRSGAEVKLRAAGLWEAPGGGPIFTGGGFGDEPGEKWDAAKKALKQLEGICGRKLPKEDVLLIGDGVYDIETAKACGFRSLATATGWTPEEALAEAGPDFLVKNLGEFDPGRL